MRSGDAATTARPTTDRWGIDDRYWDVNEVEHRLSEQTRGAILKAMDVDPHAATQADGPEADRQGLYADVVIARGPRRWVPDRRGQLRLEDGSSQDVDHPGQALELPLGYHEWRPEGADDERPIRLIATPPACHLPEDLRAWGWAVQLYAARSRRSWGIGDLGDLAALGRWSRALGAGVLMVNPLIAPTPVIPIEASPYFPSSRRFRNPLYLRIEDVPGARELGCLLGPLATSGRGLNERRRLERDAVFALKMHAFELCFARFGGAPGFGGAEGFDAYRAREGRPLTDFATFCALAEQHGKDWRRWPGELRRPDGPAVAAAAERLAARVTFHAWLQWLLDGQLRAASRDVRLIQDLPVGIDAAGADAWCWQDLLALDVSVGAPPDELNLDGQDWGLTPFIPHKLRAFGYQPLIETIRATLRHAGGLRIDHVMGLFRLYWIPKSCGGPRAGGYVRTRAAELMGLIALESERARAFVVGEDLGTVEPGVREKMADQRLLSYRLMYFEDGPPADYPELALTAITTHDLPTLAGLWTGADLARAEVAGVPQNEASLRAIRAKIAALAGPPPRPAGPFEGADPGEAADLPEVVARVHAALSAAPSRVLLATLDDALAVEERPNLPGADSDWPNWSLALPITVDDLPGRALPTQIAQALARPPSAKAAREKAPGG